MSASQALAVDVLVRKWLLRSVPDWHTPYRSSGVAAGQCVPLDNGPAVGLEEGRAVVRCLAEGAEGLHVRHDQIARYMRQNSRGGSAVAAERIPLRLVVVELQKRIRVPRHDPMLDVHAGPHR